MKYIFILTTSLIIAGCVTSPEVAYEPPFETFEHHCVNYVDSREITEAQCEDERSVVNMHTMVFKYTSDIPVHGMGCESKLQLVRMGIIAALSNRSYRNMQQHEVVESLQKDFDWAREYTVQDVVERFQRKTLSLSDEDRKEMLNSIAGNILSILGDRYAVYTQYKSLLPPRDDAKTVFPRIFPGGVVFIQVTHFNNGSTNVWIRDSISAFVKAGNVNGIILDLRNNRGGRLDISIRTADLFLETDSVIAEVHYLGERKIEKAKYQDLFEGIPVVILTNKSTASASEILTMALQENGRAKVFGQRTFGKGALCTYKYLHNGDYMLLSSGKYLSPRGRYIEGSGIEPDISIDMTGSGCTLEGEKIQDPIFCAAYDYVTGL